MAKSRCARVSLCMIALNEEQLIEGCLRSAHGIVDEIVVGIDTRTTDQTEQIAHRYGARTIPIEWRNDFSLARNTVIEQAKGDWILVLDADDRLTAAGVAVVKHVRRSRGDAVFGHVFNQLMFEVDERRIDGSRITTWQGTCRMFRMASKPRYINRVHESVPRIGETAQLMGGPHILHLGRDPHIYTLRDKVSRNLALLKLSLSENARDPFVHYYLARHYAIVDPDRQRATAHARTALAESARAENEGTVWMEPASKAELQQLLDTGSADWRGE